MERRPPLPAGSKVIAALIVGGVLLFGGGLATGVAVNKQKTHKILEEQTQLIGTIQDGQRALVEAAGKPVIIDAELRASLASTPVQCLPEFGGDALSVHCAWATCGAFNQSDAGRVECSDLTDALVATLVAQSQKGMSSSDGYGRAAGAGAGDER